MLCIEFKNKRGLIKILIILIILLIIIIGLVFAFLIISSKNTSIKNINLENPMNKIIINNTDSQGKVDTKKVIVEGIKEFTKNYLSLKLIDTLDVGEIKLNEVDKTLCE